MWGFSYLCSIQSLCQTRIQHKNMTRHIHILLILTAILMIAPKSFEQSFAQPYFPVPLVPDSLKTLQQRSDYLVEHYWDFCDLKKAFSSKPKMAESFNTYLSFMPYATAEVSHASVAKFLKSLEKQPNDLLFIAREAENSLFTDSAEFSGENLYLMFAQAVAQNKKIDRASRARFVRHAELLENNRVGHKAPDFVYTDRNGQTRNFDSDTARVVVLMISDPECEDCRMARIRLDADINATKLIDKGLLKIVSITPSAATPQWRDAVKNYPEKWVVGASDTFDDKYNFFTTPSFYLINNDHVILVKNTNINSVLDVMYRLTH